MKPLDNQLDLVVINLAYRPNIFGFDYRQPARREFFSRVILNLKSQITTRDAVTT